MTTAPRDDAKPTDASPVALVVGNPKARSRTLELAHVVGDTIAQAVGLPVVAPAEIDLATVAYEIFDWASPNVEAQLNTLRSSRLAVIASPVYKASYTGLLKAFLDRVGQGELHDVVAVPVMVGGAPQHALAVETHLRPLLVELGAVLPTRGLFVLESQLPDATTVVHEWLAAEAHPERLRRALAIA